ncbi:hypothetical protein Tel_06425 [Candidatus Tenderia electrophaga]|jgi:hypothetical protein|uniref:Exo-alpha-sialidase n=1 Tax=Candidatus Tenderia electrophaga TaxID=1748243 RepID=A0A0S2TCH5_9GAMM|nr:hypothetical protein Tel_06425 [Candidatus Tenderia electrophaga]
MKRPRAVLFAVIFLLAGPAPGHAQPHAHAGHTPVAADAPVSIANGRVPSAAFDARGRLWLAWVQNDHVYVNYSDDLGQRFSPPVAVNPEPEQIHDNGEARPKVALDRDGRVFVAYTRKLPKRFTGNIRFSRSLDGGRSFSRPLTVNDDREMISHRFVSMAVDARGGVHLAWLDARDAVAAADSGRPYDGSALYYSYSDDHGAAFQPNRKLADTTCQCCRIALALDGTQRPVFFWRHIFANASGPGSRDHALLRLGTDAAPQRISHENWRVESCPHHGPALAIGADGRRHMAWFNIAAGAPGLYYAYSDDGGRTRSPVHPFGGADSQAQHPHLLERDGRVYLVWKAFDGRRTTVQLMRSSDGGASWGAPEALAATSGESDHPFLLQHDGQVYLSWHSAADGYRLVAIP